MRATLSPLLDRYCVKSTPRRTCLWIPVALAHAVPLAALLGADNVTGSTQIPASQPSMAFVSALSVSTATGSTVELSLADAVSLGLRDNRRIRSAYLQRITQKFSLRLAQDAFAPRSTITTKLQGNRGHADRQQEYSVTPSTKLSNQWGTQFSLAWTQQFTRADQAGRKRDNDIKFEIVQPLLRGAGRAVGSAPVRVARLIESGNQLELRSKVAATVTEIVTAYRELLRAQEQQRITRAALARSRQLLEVNKALIAAGRMAEFESVQTEAQLASQELALEEAANELDQSRLKLLQLLALDQNTQVRASEVLRVERLEMNRQHAVSVALAQQPAYLQQLLAGQQADIELLLAKDQRLWDLSLVVGANQGRNHPGSVNQADRTWGSYAGIQLEIPIGDLKARQRTVTAQVAMQDHVIRLADARQTLEQHVGDGVRDISTRWRQYEIAQRVQRLSQRKLDIERDKLQLGRSSNFQVLAFEEDLLQAENAVLNAQITYLNAQTQLDERLGMTLHSWEIALND